MVLCGNFSDRKGNASVDSFNHIDVILFCPNCGERVETLQTKDDTSEPLRFETVPIEAVHSFYGQCARCNTWLDLVRRPDTPGTRPSDFILTWDPDRERALSRRGFFTRFLGR